MVALHFAVESIVKSIRWQAIPVNDSSRPEAVFVRVTGWLYEISEDEMLWFLGKTDDVHSRGHQ